MPIPVFSYNRTVSPGSAKQDKLEMRLEDGLFVGDADDAEEFLRHLGAPPRDQRDSSHIEPHGLYFTGQQGHDSRFYNQPIRNVAFVAGGTRFPAPLVSGHLEIFPSRTQQNHWILNILTSLNPTRFLRHQRLPWLLNPFKEGPPPNLDLKRFERNIGAEYDEEFALCRNGLRRGDNWLPNSPPWDRYSSEMSWQTQLRNCLTIWPRTLVTELRRSAGLVTGSQLIGPSTFNLQYVETYWEFASVTPLGTVLTLEPMLRTFSRRIVRTPDYPCVIEVEEMENSRCLKLEIRTGETLKIYAKTNRRIRFEVVHELAKGFLAPGGRHTFSSIEGVFPLLETLAEIAAKQVNKVLRHFRHEAYTPPNQFSVTRLMLEVQAACESPDKTYEILDLLANNGSIVVERGNAIVSVFGKALQRLVRKQVLKNSYGRYTVTPHYRNALAAMRHGGVGFLMAARRRLHSP